jgi:HSP20 family protein
MESDMLSISSGSPDNAQIKTDSEQGQLSLDVLETETSIVVVAPVAGVDEKNLSISITEDLLTISGERLFPSSLPKPTKKYVEECYWGKFSRSILLPTAINSAEITARLDHDIIVIEVPKARKVASKNIPLSPTS